MRIISHIQTVILELPTARLRIWERLANFQIRLSASRLNTPISANRCEISVSSPAAHISRSHTSSFNLSSFCMRENQMEHFACSGAASTKPKMGISASWLSGYINKLWSDSNSTSQPERMPQINEIQPRLPSQSPFDRLPTELVLNICSHLSPYDLWYSARPTSRLLAICAKEVLLRKVFQQSSIHISWCCFWCSLGRTCLITASKPITSLFSDARRAHMVTMSDRTLIAKLIFGDLCSMLVRGEPHIRVRLSGEEDVTVAAGQMRRQQRQGGSISPKDSQFRQYQFLGWYYARGAQERGRWRVTAALSFAAHVYGFVATSIVLVTVGFAFILIFCIVVELYKMVRSLYRSIHNLVRFCLGKAPLYL